MLTFIKDIAAFLVVFAGLGGAIDFLLSPGRKERFKDWMLKKWVEFEDLKLSNFSAQEATYFVSLSDRIFGKSLFGWRRVLSCSVIYVLCLAFWLIKAYSVGLFQVSDEFDARMLISEGLITSMFLALSVSLTRFISLRVIRFATDSKLGMVPYITLVAVHLWLFIHWRIVTEVLTANAINAIRFGIDRSGWNYFLSDLRLAVSSFLTTPRHWFVLAPSPVRSYDGAIGAARWTVSFVGNALRLLVACAILLTFAFRRWISRAVSLVWARVIEDARPTFSLMFGGIGAIAGAVKGILELYSTGQVPH